MAASKRGGGIIVAAESVSAKSGNSSEIVKMTSAAKI